MTKLRPPGYTMGIAIGLGMLVVGELDLRSFAVGSAILLLLGLRQEMRKK